MERISANQILRVVKEIGCNLQLDELTRGAGNCMIIAVLQQLKRPEILPYLSNQIQLLTRGRISVQMIISFRQAVKQFITEGYLLYITI